MALVGPNVPLDTFSALLYTLRLVFHVSGYGGGVLAISCALGDCTAILPVPNGDGTRLFISVASLVDVDSPKGRSLPCAASSLPPRPLAILYAQRLLPKDVSAIVFIAPLLNRLVLSF